MGRQSTGIAKTASVCRIDMRYLTRWGVFKHGNCSFSMEWNDGSSISLYLTNGQEGHFLTASYSLTDRLGEVHHLNYRIYIDSIPSNLGRGFVYYFLCPNTGKRCRILYRAYGSHIFRARTSYPYRLYYPEQAESKKYRLFDKKASAEDKLKNLTEGRKRKQDYFMGKRTKYSLRKQAFLERFLMLDEEADKYFQANVYN